MTAIFKQIRFEKDVSEKEDFGIRVLISICIVGLGVYLIMSGLLMPIVVAPLVLSLTLLSRPLSRRLFSNWIRANDIIGDLIFDDTMMTFTNDGQIIKTYYIDIVSIELKYNYIKGKRLSGRDIIHNGLAQLNIKTKASNSLVVKFIIEREEQLDALKPIWKELYKMGIKIQEKMFEVDLRTFLFKHGMNYEQLQELKKELNVESLY